MRKITPVFDYFVIATGNSRRQLHAISEEIEHVLEDELKDKPMVGMTLISGVKKAEGKEVWEGGKILDPENGKTYTVRLTPIEDGKKLEVRGSIGPFWRTQTWVRVQ